MDPSPTIAQQLAALPRLTVKDLQRRYVDLFGDETAARNKAWLVKRIAWKAQAAAPGGLSVHVLNQTSWSLFSLQYRSPLPRVTRHSPHR